MATDPVCGMTVEANKAAGTVNHEGQTYWLCSEDCRVKFLADPEKYVGAGESGEAGGHGTRMLWVFMGFLLVGGFFLFTEHRAHAFTVLPFLLLAACPLMHLFHRHGDHGTRPKGRESHAGHRHDEGAR